MSVAIFIQSTSRVTVSDIKDFDDATVVATTVIAKIFDKNDTEVSSATLTDQGGGSWQGSFGPLALTKGASYELQIETTDINSNVLTQRESFTATYKGWS